MTYSVFIPRIFANISEARIIQIFHNLSIGEVDHVDLLRKTGNNGQPYNMGFVHFKHLYHELDGDCFRADVENVENKTKIVYDDPWFWIVLPFEQKEQKEPQQQEQFTQQQQQFIQQPQQLTQQQQQHFTPQHIPNQGMWMMTEFGMQWCWCYPTMGDTNANGVMNHMLPPHHDEMGYDNKRMPKNRNNKNNRQPRNQPRKRLGRENTQSEPKVSNHINNVIDDLEPGEIDEPDSIS